jgi:GT2 family glycosyltransferase
MNESAKTKGQSYDFAVAYRIYPRVSKRAQSLPFGDDKLRQAEICLRSFRNSLGSLRVKVWAILDGCPGEFRELFQRYFAPEDLALIEFDGIGNRATFGKQIEILLRQEDSDLIYFAEDDYVYLAEQFPLMLRFLRDGQGVDFVTPYDHPDCYQLDLHHEPKWVTVFEGHHWRTAASTCLTFLTRKSTLARYEHTIMAYSRGNNDCAMWLSLTKRRVFNPLAPLRFLAKGEFYWKIFVQAWLFCWRQIVFGKAAKLWVPLPGLATHLCAGLLSPSIDWLTLMREEALRIGAGETFGPTRSSSQIKSSAQVNEHGVSRGSARVFVLLLNWNNWKDTNACLASLQGLNYDNWYVVVLDNGSTDGSVDRIRERFPDVEIMELRENLGFAKGNNAGIRAALQRGAEYVWLLNNDTTVDPNALRALVERAEADPKIGAVGSAIYHASEPERMQAWGGGYVDFWLGRSRNFLRPVADERIRYLTGASLLLRRSVLESLGLLDEGFFMYWEDADYCFRLRSAGLRLAVASESTVLHKGSASFENRSLLSDAYFTRSARRFFRKHAAFPLFSLWAGVAPRVLKRAILGQWSGLHAVWSEARGEAAARP